MEEMALTNYTPSELVIGRSSFCHVVLDYRTVSTTHAKVSYVIPPHSRGGAIDIAQPGHFYIQDLHSSNGTMVIYFISFMTFCLLNTLLCSYMSKDLFHYLLTKRCASVLADQPFILIIYDG